MFKYFQILNNIINIINIMEYLKDFIIGSSILVVLPFYYMVYNYQPKKTYSYYNYTFIAPLWFGIWNLISLLMAKYFGLSNRLRYFIISIISLLFIFIIARFYYNKTKEEWRFYYLQQFIKYMIIWNIVIYNLNKYI